MRYDAYKNLQIDGWTDGQKGEPRILTFIYKSVKVT